MTKVRGGSGLTLIEVLVVVAIIAVLAGLSLGALTQVRKNADRGVATANYRQIGTAIALFATDHGGTLPGPLFMGQTAFYDPVESTQLASALGPYLDLRDPPVPQPVPVFVPPTYKRDSNRLPLDQARLYVVNNAVQKDGAILSPFGEARPPVKIPMKIHSVPSSTWLVCDADQQHPRVKGTRWANQTPAKPLHPPNRLALFIDGRVDSVTDTELKPVTGPRPPPPGGPQS